MSEWYFSQYGQTQGPISETKLINKVLAQELELNDYVMNSSDGLWKRIKDVPSLLDKLHEPEKAIVHPESTDAQFSAFLEQDGRHNVYFYIPISRFVKMTILTLGLYQLYWLYKQWIYWATKRGQAHRSVDREFGWFLFPLMFLEKIAYDKELMAVERPDFNPRSLFLMWLLIGVISSVAFSGLKSFGPFFLVLPAAGYCLDLIFLLPVQQYINRVNKRLGNKYEEPGFGHKVCLVLGGLGWLYMVIDLFKGLFVK